MLIGYARVSTQDQDTAAQMAALQTSGCELIFQEKASGGPMGSHFAHGGKGFKLKPGQSHSNGISVVKSNSYNISDE